MSCPVCREELSFDARFNVNRGLMAALAEQSAATQREAALVSAVRLAVKEAAELRQKLSLLATSSLGAATARDGIELQVAGADEQHRSEESQPGAAVAAGAAATSRQP